MDKTHRRIVDEASRLMRKQGIETTSVNDVMNKAGLTHGGFYRHFDSKEALVDAALTDAFEDGVRLIEEGYCTLGVKKGAQAFSSYYLSQHIFNTPSMAAQSPLSVGMSHAQALPSKGPSQKASTTSSADSPKREPGQRKKTETLPCASCQCWLEDS